MNAHRFKSTLNNTLRSNTGSVYLVWILVLCCGGALTGLSGRSFFTEGNITDLLTSTTVLGLVVVGQTLVILLGSLDLSVPFVLSLSSVLAAGVMAGRSENSTAGIVTAILVSLAIGLVNGLLVGLVKINGFIATLGTGLVVSGYLFTNYRGSTGKASPELAAIGSASWGVVPWTTVAMVLCLVATALFLNRTRTGLHIYAVGGDPAVTRMSGIRESLPAIVAHSLSGLFAGLAGLVIVARLGVGSPEVGTQGGYDLLSIAAVVVGGAVLAGGKGSIWGSLGGILIFATIDSLLGIMEVNPYLKEVVRGLIIIIAVAVYAKRNQLKRSARFDSLRTKSTSSMKEGSIR
ncbi:ABC transporter permease (plasmid) [Arthrobacter sp. NtRootA4]|uniref:Putative ribose ABC transporter n=1 Tax=Paenarthrobacter nicotinovorans TaxID=29320 RepID=Q8GAL2_PAENI|nr:ABC transporter permease [Paenarthrobacter nicotinovorans]BCW12956.1 ABC transporter permease [Arthrobacter sp. NtRootA2]BCW17159.1 ABC transporter permease [Arthrobacter sp. NtRootA4]BCW25267.1 ABC transporter permease [Arthrobacter sp. NtRootC7]BCW29629.1 ABC transporter permease [Arthrobacter sp. NtRootC45]BCW33834.1 ABC transporter permease [Arthrobacter sp. NtRootD5]